MSWSRRGGRSARPRVAGWATVALSLAVVVVVNVVFVEEKAAVYGMLVITPLLAWILLPARDTALTGVITLGVGVALARRDGPLADVENVIRLGFIVTAGIAAVVLAVARVRAQRLLTELRAHRTTAAAAVARAEDLRRITEAALGHVEVDEMLAAVLVRVRDALGADAATVLLCDEDQQLRVGVSAGSGPGTPEEVTAAGHEIAGTVVGTGRPLVVGDLDPVDPESRVVRGPGSLAACPLEASGSTIGVLFVTAAGRHRFGADEVHHLEEVSAWLAHAIERVRLFQDVRDRDATTHAILDTVVDAIITIDPRGRILTANPAAERTFGYSTDEMVGRNVAMLIPEPDRSQRREYLRRDRETGERRNIGVDREVRGQRKDGTIVPLEIAIGETTVQGRTIFVGCLRDLRERKAGEDMARAALHDPLTGLANRLQLTDRLTAALAGARRHGGLVALLFIDLDRFKPINDSLGHDAGDELLVKVAARLHQVLRAEDLLVRFGGDEFVVMCEALSSGDHAVDLSKRMQRALEPPFLLAGTEVTVSASIGVALSTDATDATDLLRSADAAMYRAKRRGRGGAALYDADLEAELHHRLALESELRRALDEGQFVLHYQPLIDLRDGGTLGAEALLRWQHPERGLLAPAAFLAAAEASGLLLDIGTWVVREACREAASWTGPEGGSAPTVSVNLSARELSHPGTAVAVADALEDAALHPRQLCIELAEDLVMADAAASMRLLGALRETGVRLAVDGFGTGFSSLACLRSLPLDRLKLDRSFLTDIDRRSGRSIVDAALGLAEGLGLAVVAEGVERPEQVAALRDAGYQLAQGHHLGGPVPASELAGLRPGLVHRSDGADDPGRRGRNRSAVGPAGIEPATKGL
jgi:diguanylate cyclase (GGDEF)-like protein/PAS domain S-box-containing protein